MKRKAFIDIINNKNLTPKELFTHLLSFKQSIIDLSSSSELEQKSELTPFIFFNIVEFSKLIYDFGITDKEVEKDFKYFNLNISSKCTYSNKPFVEDICNSFEKSIHRDLNKNSIFLDLHKNYNSSLCSISTRSDYKTNDLDDVKMYFKLNIGTEELNSFNLLELIKLYNNFKELQDMSDIKTFKTLFFGNITAKKFNPFIEELENSNDIIVERTKSGSVKNIIINSDKEFDENKEFKLILNDLFKRGVVKNLSGSQTTKNRNFSEFVLSDYSPYDNLYLSFIYENNNISLKLSSHTLHNTSSLLKETGFLQDFNNYIINDFINIKIPIIEKILGYSFYNKNDFDNSFEIPSLKLTKL